MAPRKTFRQDEGEPHLYECDLVDKGVPVPGSALQTLRLTYYVADQADVSEGDEIINGHNGAADMLLPGSGVTVDGNGHLKWQQEADDVPIKNPKCGTELHVGRWDYTYQAGSVVLPGSHEFAYRVTNLRRKS